MIMGWEEMRKKYVRYIKPSFPRFDPIGLLNQTEKIVCSGDKRKYTGFSATKEYGGIVTGYTVGCCLRCVFCWADWSRDFPERAGHFYSPEEAFSRMMNIARSKGITKLRISGAEPTIGKEHLLRLLELGEKSENVEIFYLETNGMYFGIDKNYAEKISKFKKVHVRVSLKAGGPEEFAKKTGANPNSFGIPFQAIRNLIDVGAEFNVAAVTDPRIITQKERDSLIRGLRDLDPSLLLTLEEEILEPFHPALARLSFAGYNKWHFAIPYYPVIVFFRLMRKNIRNQKFHSFIRKCMSVLFESFSA